MSEDRMTITRKGMRIDCYGKWEEDSNCLVVGDYNNGHEMEDIWAGDGWPADKPFPKNWTEVVEHLADWAEANGHDIQELSAV